MLGDGVRDGGFLASSKRDVAPDDALQLGEFADRLRHEIGLGEMRSALRIAGIAPTDGASSRARRLMRPTRSSCVPSFSWNVTCPRSSVSRSRGAPSRSARKIWRRTARADHALIAGDDSLAAVFSLKVPNQNKAIGKVPDLKSRSEKH